jgi:ribosomal protein S5
MGNGHGIISYAKGSGKDKLQSLQKTLFFLKKNLIAIPRDPKCTFPLPITKRFQDYRLYLKPNPGFNSHGHPVIAFMLTLTGMDHCRFHVAHTGHNIYNVLKVFFKAITNNTTPQELAEQ